MAGTRIADSQELRAYQRHLEALGYQTVETFLAAVHVAGDSLSAYLGTDARRLAESLPQHAQLQQLNFYQLQEPFALGVKLDAIPRPKSAFTVTRPPDAAPPGPTSVSLIGEMPPIRDQGRRGTCVAFATAAVIDHYFRRVRQNDLDFSEQFLYWDCKQNDGHPNDSGTWVALAMSLDERDGICSDVTWPYNPNPISGNEGQGPPPATAQGEASDYRVTPIHNLPPTSVQDLRNELLSGRCVAFSIPVFNSWYLNNDITRTGDIVLPIPGEQALDSGHAMCIVGFQDLADEPALGSGRFILRNSWGAYWATESSMGTAGYGTIPYAYIARYGQEAFSIG